MDTNDQRKLALKIFKGDKFIALRKAIKEGKCFDVLLKIADKKEAIKLWDKFLDEWKCYASEYWNGISDEMIKKHSQNLMMKENILKKGE